MTEREALSDSQYDALINNAEMPAGSSSWGDPHVLRAIVRFVWRQARASQPAAAVPTAWSAVTPEGYRFVEFNRDIVCQKATYATRCRADELVITPLYAQKEPE